MSPVRFPQFFIFHSAVLVSLALQPVVLRAQPPAVNQAAMAQQQQATAEDHRNMLEQLGIKALRPGPSGNEKAPDHANYDVAKANPFPDWPDVLKLKNGKPVKSAKSWWKQRRPEIIEDFEREVLGRVPARTPKVNWIVEKTENATSGGVATIEKQLVGRLDNLAYPAISVEIQMTLVLPAKADSPVPVMIMFGSRAMQKRMAAMMASRPEMRVALGNDPPAAEQLIADGWGYALLDPSSVQADNGAGLTKGVIGLVNHGQRRKPEDWGALRAWAWGASRALDYLETEKAVNSRQVGIEGVSRYGKAALVTMAFDQRFAVVLVGSSGEGGAKPHRRNFGEAVENLTGSGEYHWMAGNFLKYGAAESRFGSRNAGDIPVDSHELIALCAPRLTFVSYGIPERGDANWLDQQGSYMATVAAGRVFRLLGAKDLGVGDDYRNARMPAVNVSQLDGKLAWRQHDGGHTDAPNWRYFLPWADRLFGRPNTPLPPAVPVAAAGADQPRARVDANSMVAHSQLLDKARLGGIDVYFAGDSITRRWGALDRPDLLANWKQNFFGWNAADFGWGADRIENMLWRLDNGELDGVNPKVIVLLAGTNNIGNTVPPEGDDARVADITRGLEALLKRLQAKAPAAVIIATAIFPRNDNPAVMPAINRVNSNIEKLADGRHIRFLNINDKLAGPDGTLRAGMMDADKLHPALPAYQIWADALKPLFTELLGPPAAADHAPPATGDPSAARR